mmetsp:Transcript_59522/g.137569  ORF Transcript_59522/g.137569 Transcript_59522/m.137569 type:complete len:225 (-) Transcript_59522:449-1123(-)
MRSILSPSQQTASAYWRRSFSSARAAILEIDGKSDEIMNCKIFKHKASCVLMNPVVYMIMRPALLRMIKAGLPSCGNAMPVTEGSRSSMRGMTVSAPAVALGAMAVNMKMQTSTSFQLAFPASARPSCRPTKSMMVWVVTTTETSVIVAEPSSRYPTKRGYSKSGSVSGCKGNCNDWSIVFTSSWKMGRSSFLSSSFSIEPSSSLESDCIGCPRTFSASPSSSM